MKKSKPSFRLAATCRQILYHNQHQHQNRHHNNRLPPACLLKLKLRLRLQHRNRMRPAARNLIKKILNTQTDGGRATDGRLAFVKVGAFTFQSRNTICESIARFAHFMVAAKTPTAWSSAGWLALPIPIGRRPRKRLGLPVCVANVGHNDNKRDGFVLLVVEFDLLLLFCSVRRRRHRRRSFEAVIQKRKKKQLRRRIGNLQAPPSPPTK